MKRAERLYALVDSLRGSSRPVTAARLAAEFEVSTRTIERDISTLQGAGVPIYTDRGRTGGYSILKEHSLPPLNLTATESLAVLAGLGILETSPYGAAARRARAKVLAVITDDRLASLDRVLSDTRIIEADPPRSDRVTDLLADAIVLRRVVHVTYASADRKTVSERDVETMGLLRGGDAWILVGWCRLRGAIRGFYVDRILELTITGEVSPTRDPALLEADLAPWRTRRLSAPR